MSKCPCGGEAITIATPYGARIVKDWCAECGFSWGVTDV